MACLVIFVWCLWGYIAFDVCFCLKPSRLYGICCVFSRDASKAIWHVYLSYLTSPCLYGMFISFRLMPSWLYGMFIYFCLMPSSLYGIYCLFLPEASEAIQHLLCVFAWCLRGYTTFIVCFCLTPPRLYDMFISAWCLCGYMACLFVFAWCLRDYMACCLFPPDASEAIWHLWFVLPTAPETILAHFVWFA